MSDQADYKYIVSIVVDVKRTDGDHLNEHENAMVKEMHDRAAQVVAEVMNEHGMNNQKNLGTEIKKY